ncbi:MAG: T9SS type A sorting domain-containing protein [Flavobacteriales bacterium]|nr:T9SS type A sorting domain-containing protein [Flavobacteriales bacterium]
MRSSTSSPERLTLYDAAGRSVLESTDRRIQRSSVRPFGTAPGIYVLRTADGTTARVVRQ